MLAFCFDNLIAISLPIPSVLPQTIALLFSNDRSILFF